MMDIVSPFLHAIDIESGYVDFYYSSREKLKKLSGYQSGKHFLPKYYSKSLEDFVANISKTEIESVMSGICDRLRELMKLGVHDYHYEVNSTEGGFFESGHLSFHLNCKPDEENLAEVVFMYRMTVGRQMMPGLSGLMQAFPFEFSYARISFPAIMDLKQFIHQLELFSERTAMEMQYYYDPGVQYLEVSNRSTGKIMMIYPDHMDIYFSGSYTIDDFLEKW